MNRIEGLPLPVLSGHVEQREEGREGGLQGPIEGQQFAGDFLADFPAIVAGLDLEVGPEKVHHGQVGRGRPVRHRAALQDEPALRPVGAGELPNETRLAHAGLAHQCDDLAVTSVGPLQSLAEMVEFSPAADEPGQSSGRRRLEARPRGPRAAHLIGLHRRSIL